ncbi:MAG: MmgE/PrpD family protein [Gammaproteobacteria bacterium]
MPERDSSREPATLDAPGVPGLTVHIPTLTGEEPLEALTRFVLETRYEDIAPEVIEFAKRLFIDVLGVTIGGSSQESIPELVDYVRYLGGRPDSMLPFYGGRYPASSVALALAPMSRALDMGDVHLGWEKYGFSVIGHTAEYTAPTLLALLGRVPNATGKDLLAAFALGTEVLVRIGAAAYNTNSGRLMGLPGNFDQGGWYIFGAVAAAARLLGMDARQTLNALGMARGMTQTHDMKSMSPASHWVRVHHGFVSKNAIDACELALRGINGPRDVMLGYRGFLFAVSRGLWPVKPQLLLQDLGNEWFFTQTSIKPFSACKATHTGATGLQILKARHGFAADDIEEVCMDVSKNTFELVCMPEAAKWNPQTDQNAQFSLAHVAATVAIDGKLLIDGFQQEARDRPEIAALRKRIKAKIDPNIPVMDTRVSVRLKSGETHSMHCNDTKGSPSTPLTDLEWRDRFASLCRYSAYPVTRATADALLERLFTLEDSVDVVADIILPLTPH